MSYCMAPSTVPSVSRNQQRVPTVGITVGGISTVPPLASMACTVAAIKAG